MNRKELDPTASPRESFGALLRSSREALGWTQQDLAAASGYSDSYISAVETGRKSTSRDFVRAVDKALGTGQTLELMWVGMRRKGFLEGFPEHAAQEARAAEIRIFEPNLIPGLFQTKAYASAIEAGAVHRGSSTQDQAEERVKFLVTRQRLLKRAQPPVVHAVIDESALRRPVGGSAIMRAQIDHLAEMATRPHVIFQVAPFGLAEHAPFRSFLTLLTFADRSVVGYTETADHGFVVREERTVRAWEKAYDRLQVEALTRAASLDLIRKAREEGLFLTLQALRSAPEDIVLAVSPTYVGLAGAARLAGLPVWPVHSGPQGIDLDHLAARLAAARARGLRPRALYVIPDAANPTGVSMDLATRRALVAAAAKERLLLLEDNAYSMFAGPDAIPSLKAVDQAGDRTGVVVYLGSFAKSALPGARVGYVVADQRVAGQPGLFSDQLAVLKSMVTVNTSPIAQAVVGGALLSHRLSLRAKNRPENALYSRSRERMLRALADRFSDRPDVNWNSPTGGFFLTLSVPFDATDGTLEHSAGIHGVLWTPMRYFYADGGGARQIRLSFSQVTEREIEEGIDRLRALVDEVAPITRL